MRHVRIWAAMLLGLLMMAACADAPTAPQDAGLSAGNDGPSSTYLLPGIIVIGDPQ